MSIGKSIPHDSSRGHVTGQSIFVDDRPMLGNELWVSYVGSPVSAGNLERVEFKEALKVSGVVGIYTAKDFHHNRWGTIVSEQPVLVDDEIGYIDEPVCIVAAETKEALNDAKKRIQVLVREKKPIFSIDDAIQAKKFIYQAHPFKKGDADQALKKAPHRLKGFFECGGQEHFYMESQASVVYPLENGQLEIHSSSQHPTETQHVVAETLGLSLHQVTCVVKRMGGGFGGKESQAAPFAAMAALVAQKTKRPARIALTKDEDMQVTGKRHPFKNFYEVGFDDEGRLLSLKAQIYADGGAYADLSSSILDRAMSHIDGAYYLENAWIEGAVCRTNRHSNTAFRGFGGPQGTMTIESILEDIAQFLGKDAYQIRRLNVYGIDDRNITPYGQKVEQNVLPELYDQLHKTSDYELRLAKILEFNSKNSGKIRGLSMTGVKFGIAFTTRFLNQANALVNLQRDGSVQVSTGATEMGQGVNTKIQQVVAHAFGILPMVVQVMPTSTEKNHNTSPTAASAGADLNCGAALKAANRIKERLMWIAQLQMQGVALTDLHEFPELDSRKIDFNEFQFEKGDIVHSSGKKFSLCEIIRWAFLSRVSLGEYAHFRTEGLGFDKKLLQGRAFNYFTNGAAVSEVEIDEWTGELKVLRVDLLMDLGRPLNPGIDRGQVTGAFIQGMGWVTTENLYYQESGKLISHSPTTYKIPNIQDTPRIFNVDLLSNDQNIQNVHRSKAVGEPPLLLGSSVWTAVKHAISCRSPRQVVAMKSPATNEEILMTLAGLKS